jgi:chloramphenicol-sensitive protein RarD
MKNTGRAIAFAITANLMWGLFPLYWPLLKPANSFEIVAHRAIWTLVFCSVVLLFSKKFRSTLALLKSKHNFVRLTFSTIFISGNWLIYVWGVNHGHVVECALGYYINPLVMVLFGVVLLKEKMRRLQWVAVAIAAVGVLILALDYGHFPWVALGLTFSWGSYGLTKKKLGLGGLEGIMLETLLSAIPYGAYLLVLAHNGTGQFGHHPRITVLLMCAGIVTAVPLLLFNNSVNQLPYTLIGLFQYIVPTVQFLIGVFKDHEKMTSGRWMGFAIVWIALITLGVDLVQSGRNQSRGASNDNVAQLD